MLYRGIVGLAWIKYKQSRLENATELAFRRLAEAHHSRGVRSVQLSQIPPSDGQFGGGGRRII